MFNLSTKIGAMALTVFMMTFAASNACVTVTGPDTWTVDDRGCVNI